MRAKKGEYSTEISFALQHTHTGTHIYTLIHSEWAVYLGFTAENNAQILFERSVQLKTGGQSNGRVASGQLGIELTHTHTHTCSRQCQAQPLSRKYTNRITHNDNDNDDDEWTQLSRSRGWSCR